MGVYRDRKDGYWYIDYYHQGRRKREKVGSSRKLAEQVLLKRKVEIAENRLLDIRKDKKIKFEHLANEYIERHAKPYKKSWRQSDVINRKNLTAFFYGKYLYEVTPKRIEDYKLKRMKEVSPATVNRELACLKHMFNKGIEWDMAESNPVKKVKLFKENNVRVRFLEREEIKKLLANCSEPLRSIVAVALNTGMRRGEIFNLRWRDLDLKRGIIHLEQTKSGERRQIPINSIVGQTLVKINKHVESPYVFCYGNGKPLMPSTIRKSFLNATKKSGIMNFRFHDLRHTFASQLVMSGVDLNTVRELLGHKSLDMTLRYSHLSPDHKKRAVDLLNGSMDSYVDSKPKYLDVAEDSILRNSLITSKL